MGVGDRLGHHLGMGGAGQEQNNQYNQ
jgi:hypothetical protein